MAFKVTKGAVTIEAFVTSAPGGMFKGYIRVTTQKAGYTLQQTTGRNCGRPVSTADAALALAEAEAKRCLEA